MIIVTEFADGKELLTQISGIRSHAMYTPGHYFRYAFQYDATGTTIKVFLPPRSIAEGREIIINLIPGGFLRVHDNGGANIADIVKPNALYSCKLTATGWEIEEFATVDGGNIFEALLRGAEVVEI